MVSEKYVLASYMIFADIFLGSLLKGNIFGHSEISANQLQCRLLSCVALGTCTCMPAEGNDGCLSIFFYVRKHLQSGAYPESFSC